MPSTSNRLEIYNQALGFIGTRSVGSPNEHTPEAIQCELYWDRARRSTLRDYPYRFAMRRVRLPEKELPEVYAMEWRLAYGIPDTALKVVRVHCGRARLNKAPYSIEQGDEGPFVLTDVDQAMADVVVDVEDITQWDDTFVAAMARRLACMICVPLLKSDAKLGMLTQMYQASIPAAEGDDASEAYDRKEPDAWLMAREGWR